MSNDQPHPPQTTGGEPSFRPSAIAVIGCIATFVVLVVGFVMLVWSRLETMGDVPVGRDVESDAAAYASKIASVPVPAGFTDEPPKAACEDITVECRNPASTICADVPPQSTVVEQCDAFADWAQQTKANALWIPDIASGDPQTGWGIDDSPTDGRDVRTATQAAAACRGEARKYPDEFTVVAGRRAPEINPRAVLTGTLRSETVGTETDVWFEATLGSPRPY